MERLGTIWVLRTRCLHPWAHLPWTCALATIAALALGTSAAQAYPFCETSVVHDYSQPLQDLPDLRPPPREREVPFGPGNFFLDSVGQRPLIFESERVGFTLFHGRVPGGVVRPRIDWLVSSKLARVDRRGQVVEPTGGIVKHVTGLGSSDGRRFWFQLPAHPGLYRLEIVFENHAGKRLARFGEYIRVLRHTPIDARLTLDDTTFTPGQTVSATVENYGTGVVSFGLGERIEVFDGSNWINSSIDPPGSVPLILLWAGPGEAASCWDFSIPSDAPPGLYRFVVEADHSYQRPPGRRTPLLLTSDFQIDPAS